MGEEKPRFVNYRLSSLLIVIAMIGLMLGGARWAVELRTTIQDRPRRVKDHEREAMWWSKTIGWVDEPNLNATRVPNPGDLEHEKGPPFIYSILLYEFPNQPTTAFNREHRTEVLSLCRQRVSFREGMRAKCVLAAWTPWWPIEADEPPPPIGGKSVPCPAF